jgi:glutamate dehydrogenase/leucine dehydrogenase/CBS domain-containing protein
MIPQAMESYLRAALPSRTWEDRIERKDGMAWMEFGPLDVDRLGRLGIEVDNLGPQLVVCMWDEESSFEVGGYLVVDNLAMGKPSMGGIRMLGDVTPAAILNLARGMTLKNAAANLPYGGGKAGVVSDEPCGTDAHRQIIRRFSRLINRYNEIYLPGPDVGTNDQDMGEVAAMNGLDNALSKPAAMGGNRIDQLGAAAGGVVIAIDELLTEMPRLKDLPQFSSLDIPDREELTVLIQGFGAVGAHAARLLASRYPHCKVQGISDADGYLYAELGLPVEELFEIWSEERLVTRRYFADHEGQDEVGFKFSSDPNDLLRESAFCLIPAAPVAHYLDVDAATKPSMTINRMGRWSVIVEGANTYSPDPQRKTMRARMEREVYRRLGVLIVTDYLVNSGGVIYAAQEHLVKTPAELRLPQAALGDPAAVQSWLDTHAEELAALAETRRKVAEIYREDAIRANMGELVDLLLEDPDRLPYEAAERISVRRIAAREYDRTAADVMDAIPELETGCTLPDAARALIESGCPIVAVLEADGSLAGVATAWDITQAVARGEPGTTHLAQVMTRSVISVAPDDGLMEIIGKLEHHEISAMPVVEAGHVLGMVSTDLLATRSLARLLQSEMDLE